MGVVIWMEPVGCRILEHKTEGKLKADLYKWYGTRAIMHITQGRIRKSKDGPGRGGAIRRLVISDDTRESRINVYNVCMCG